MIKSLIGLFLFILACPARAAFKIPGYELVYSYPVETTLDEPDLRQAYDVWPELFDQAGQRIDIEQFYVSPSTDDAVLEPSFKALERAAKRGVKIRVLLERKFLKNSVDGIARLANIPGLELRILDWGAVGKTGKGIIHAKFFVVDSSSAFVGSQNFDWRALDQIHELGLAVTNEAIVGQIRSVFDHDWALAGATDWAIAPAAQPVAAHLGQLNYLVASPWRYNPPGVGDSESELVYLIGHAKEEIVVQNYDYLPMGFGANASSYTIIDDALRAAAARGVKIKLLLDRGNEDERHMKFLKPLAQVKGVEIRFMEIPDAKRGHIDFARVVHTKTMVIDGKLLWLGTSNWAGGYLDESRNLELVVHDEGLAARVAAVHKHLWDSTYAVPIEMFPEQRDWLWHIVSQCMDASAPDYCVRCRRPLPGKCGPTPCPETSPVWSVEKEFVAIQDRKMCGCPLGFVHGLALPRVAVKGVEDPKRPDGLWDFAWKTARVAITDESAILLAVNGPTRRTQDQLHVHMVRLSADGRKLLAQAMPETVPDLKGVWKAAARSAKKREIKGWYGIAVARADDGKGFIVAATASDHPETEFGQAFCK